MLRIQDPPEESKQEEVRMTLDGLAQEGARQLLMTALEEEVSDYIERHVQERDEKGHALVVRNGRAQARKLTMGCGTMELEAPRVTTLTTNPKLVGTGSPSLSRGSPTRC